MRVKGIGSHPQASKVSTMQSKKIGTDKEQAIFGELLLNPKFQKTISELRTKHGIPPKGFKNKKAYLRWWETYDFEYKELKVTQEVFNLDINDKPTLASKRVSERKVKIYYLDLCKVLKELDLSLEWIPFIDECMTMDHNVMSKGKISYYFANLTRETCEDIVINEELHLHFGATMNLKRLFDDPHGSSIWMKEVEPLQSVMQGYREKGRRPKRSKTILQAKIYRKSQAGLKDKEIWDDLPELEDFYPEVVRQHKRRFKNKISPNS